MGDLTRQELNTVTDAKRIIYTPSYFAKSTLFYIQEIGRLKSLRPHRNSRKSLSSYLFVAVVKGTGLFTYDKKTHQLKEGDQVFIDCSQPYFHESNESNPWELIWIHFNGVNMDRYYMYFNSKFNDIFVRALDFESSKTLHKKLLDLAETKDNSMELQISALLYQLVTDILISDKTKVSSSIADKMEKIKEYIDLSYYEKISLDILSEKFYISKYYMAREFKKKYGISIIQYTINQKITKSKELLRYTNLQIDEIASQVGIDDNSYFNKIFQKMEDITASEYRKQWRNK